MLARRTRLLVLAALAAPLAARAEPNILVLVADDMGVDKVASYADDYAGYSASAARLPNTTAIDALAASGMRFTQAWAAPTCSPTRSLLLTGRYGFRTGIGETVERSQDLDLDAETLLGDVLGDSTSGTPYATALIGKWHLGEMTDASGILWYLSGADYLEFAATVPPLLGGFDYYSGTLHGQVNTYWDWERATGETTGFTVLERMDTYVDDQQVEDALGWINAQSGPWFAEVAFNAPHTQDATGAYEASDVKSGCHTVTCLDDGTCTSEPRAVYQGLVECMDTSIQALLDGIPSSTLEDTIIVFIGDNGTSDGIMEYPFNVTGDRSSNGKGTVYETGVHVPMIVTQGKNWLEWQACSEADRAAGTCTFTEDLVASPGRSVETPLLVADLFATLAEVGGHTETTGTDSLSFYDCFSNPDPTCGGAAADPTRTLYTELWYNSSRGTLASGKAAVRVGDQKLVAIWDSSAGCVGVQLFDLAADPTELTDLAGTEVEEATALKHTMEDVGPGWLTPLPWCSVSTPADRDGDGYEPSRSGGHDCDDGDATINPEATEVWYDGVDQNCDGADDYDQDADGYSITDDCDDTDPAVAGTSRWYADTDGDGFGDPYGLTNACTAPAGYVDSGRDCDDTRADVSPAGVEVCDDADNDCDGSIDEEATDPATWYRDADSDGYGVDTDTTTGCDAPDGYVAAAGDCDDANPDLSPAEPEVCDDIDQDCDGMIDEEPVDPAAGFLDADGDGYGSDPAVSTTCTLPDGMVAIDGDCDDSNNTVFPGAPEHCDGVDEDCDTTIDEEAVDASPWYLDADADGYGVTDDVAYACDPLDGRAAQDGDCNDADATASTPGTVYTDADGDGHGDPAASSEQCGLPDGYAATGDDCDDADAAVYADCDTGGTVDKDEGCGGCATTDPSAPLALAIAGAFVAAARRRRG